MTIMQAPGLSGQTDTAPSADVPGSTTLATVSPIRPEYLVIQGGIGAASSDWRLADWFDDDRPAPAEQPREVPRGTRRIPGGRPYYAEPAVTVYFADEEHRYRAGGAFRAWDGQEGYAGRSDWMASLTQRCVEEWRCEHAADNQQGIRPGRPLSPWWRNRAKRRTWRPRPRSLNSASRATSRGLAAWSTRGRPVPRRGR
jgi:hypothetical protein